MKQKCQGDGDHKYINTASRRHATVTNQLESNLVTSTRVCQTTIVIGEGNRVITYTISQCVRYTVSFERKYIFVTRFDRNVISDAANLHHLYFDTIHNQIRRKF